MSNQSFKKKPPVKKRVSDEYEEDDIFQAPVILRDPTSRQVKLGGKFVVRIQATGKPLPSYQWFHNGKKIVGANSDRLTLSKVRRSASGAYHCEAKNHVGKAVSRVCMISFFTQSVPQLVIGPEVSKLQDGKPFSLKVVSPPVEELKEFKVFWTFNGMRIKGAHGPELNITAVKKKYEGEYKALIAAGGNLETSNVAKLKVVPAKTVAPTQFAPAESKVEAPLQEPSKTLDEILATEPTMALDTPAPKPAVAWESFNPEDDEPAEEELVAPSNTPESFGNTSPGTPVGGKPPLSQLATQDLIREVAAEGGVSELLEKEQVELSGLIQPMEEVQAIETENNDDDNLIADWGDAVVAPKPAQPAAAKPSPQLIRKKEFLENFLAKWQSQVSKKSARAA